MNYQLKTEVIKNNIFYNEGFLARLKGLWICAYKEGSEMYLLWMKGYKDCQDNVGTFIKPQSKAAEKLGSKASPIAWEAVKQVNKNIEAGYKIKAVNYDHE